jgi:hypothetical protein
MRSIVCAPLVAALLLATLALLAGCDLPYFQEFQQKYAFTEEKELSKGWIVGAEVPPEPIYCYRTLAEADCYTAAEPQRERGRLIGMFAPEGY